MEFQAVILGTDNNAYSMARSVHMEYGLSSYCLGVSRLKYTDGSKIATVLTYPHFDEEEGFLEGVRSFLASVGNSLEAQGVPLVLIPCSDGYAKLAITHREELEKNFLLNLPSLALQQALEDKLDFYHMAELHGLPYPKTAISERGELPPLPFSYPIAIKPNDSILYAHLNFPEKKKAYCAEDENEAREILERVYQAGYRGKMILQDFIPGGTEVMGVLNAYVDTRGRVTLMAYAKCILDECLPTQIGNYNALLSTDAPALYAEVKHLLEAIDYRGFANFDFKFDSRDGTYKCFEINLRQGRSSFYVTAAGENLARYLIEDVLHHKSLPETQNTKEILWLFCAPPLLKPYAHPEDWKRIRPLVERKAYVFTDAYSKDRGLKRLLHHWRRRLSTQKYYPRLLKS